MKVTDFFLKYNNDYVDFDGAFGYQCVDLYRQYCKEVLNVVSQSPLVVGANNIWTTYRQEDFDQIENTLEGVPQLGDVVIWKKTNVMQFGHVAIFKDGDDHLFNSFDQNWPVGSKCHFQEHNYSNVFGWLRPKNLDEIQPVIIDQNTIDLGAPWGKMDIQTIRNTLNSQARKIERLEAGFWNRWMPR